MSNWEAYKSWSDQYIPEIKKCLSEVLIGEPSEVCEDRDHNTDLCVLDLKPKRVACRVRDDKYRERYGDEFTIRTNVPSGNKSELAKIIEGWGDYIFYGFADDEGLTQWFIGDLSVFRYWFTHTLALMDKGECPGAKQVNHDGSSGFRAFKKDEIEGFIVAEGGRDNA